MSDNKIITFYSFKGGAGRSQLLANLASYACFYEGKKVLIIDWDLEAPGIDFFFNFDRSKIKKGLIDFFEEYIALMRSKKNIEENELPIFDDASIYNIHYTKEGGMIDLIPVTNYNIPDYTSKINGFNWFDFWDRLDGRYYIEFLKLKLKESKYDYIFIDSRTGISDYSGICNIQLPDINVIVVAPTEQNIAGAFYVTKKILESPYTDEKRPNPKIIPVLSRIDRSDNKNLIKWQTNFVDTFSDIIINSLLNANISKLVSDDYLNEFIGQTMINYDVDMSYGEKLVFNNIKADIVTGSIEETFINIWKYILGQNIIEDLENIYLKLSSIGEIKKNNVGGSEKTSDRIDELLLQINTALIPHHLTKPPFMPEVFLGREDDLVAVKQKLYGSDNFLLLVSGEGGIGKTSLASKYYHQFQNEYSHVAWILSEKSITGALLPLSLPLGLKFEDTASQEERLEIVLTAMAQLKKPCLLVIDNANELEDLEKQYENLRRCTNFHLLITTRITNFGQAEVYEIEGLSDTMSLKLFKKHYTRHIPEEDGLFKQIYEAVGGNTLIIEILAKNLQLLNKLRTKYTLSDLLADIQKKGLLAISQSHEVGVKFQKITKAKPQDIIAAMYDLGELSLEETAALSIFAVLPAESIIFSTLENLILDKENLGETLLQLAKKGWLDCNEEAASFKCSPVIQEITKSKNVKLYDDCLPLIKALIKKLDYEDSITGILKNITYDEAPVYSQYAENIVFYFENAENNLAILCDKLGVLYESTGNLDKALDFFEKYYRLNEELHRQYPIDAGFKNSLAISCERLGDLYQSLGRLDKALDFFEKCNQIGEDLNRDYPTQVVFKNGLAISYEKLGDLYQTLGNLDKALDFFEKGNQISEDLNREYPTQISFKNGLAISYEKIGNLNQTIGNFDKALDFFERYNQITEDLYRDHPTQIGFKNGLAISYQKLGDLNQKLGNLDKALDFFEKYNKITENLNLDYPTQVGFKNNLAISYSKLGDLHQTLGNLDEALDFFKKDCKISEELRRSYPAQVGFKNNLAISYSKLGTLNETLGNLDNALDFFEKYCKISEELHRDYPTQVSFKNGLAVSYSKLGALHQKLGNLGNALDFFEKDCKISEELHRDYPTQVGFKNGLAVSYSQIGSYYKETKNRLQTIQHFNKADKLWVELARDVPKYLEFQNNLKWLRRQLDELELVDK